jgi:hypothetical protein
MLADLRADSAAWQAEKKKQKSDNMAAATEDVYPGKQPDMSYQKHRFQCRFPNDYSPTCGPNEGPKIPSLRSDLVSSDSALSNPSAKQKSQLETDSSHAYRPSNDLHMNRALEGGTCLSGQSAIAREVTQGPGFGADDKTLKPGDASAAGSQCARN